MVAGHIAAASMLIKHHRGRYSGPLSGPNVVGNVLHWAAAGYCGLAGPAMVAMLVDAPCELAVSGADRVLYGSKVPHSQ